MDLHKCLMLMDFNLITLSVTSLSSRAKCVRGAQWTIWLGHEDKWNIKKIYECMVNNVNISVLKLENPY